MSRPVELAQYLSAEYVIDELGLHGARRLRSLTAPKILVLGILGGAFITTGALFSVLLATGIHSPGVERLLEGLGFSSGFFFVIFSGAALFTEANVVLPATAVRNEPGISAARIARFWAIALLGNYIGALIIAFALHLAQHYPADVNALLDEIVQRKLSYREIGGTGAWFQIVLSGVLANWLVGMAAFFATMGRTIIGKFIPCSSPSRPSSPPTSSTAPPTSRSSPSSRRRVADQDGMSCSAGASSLPASAT